MSPTTATTATATSPSDPFLSTLEVRRSIYTLTNTLPISASRVTSIVSHAIQHCPSPFNTQSARTLILSGSAHTKLWDMGDAMLKQTLPPAAYQGLAPKVAGFRAAYGTIMFFDDQAPLREMGEKNPAVKDMMGQWSEHASGMVQFAGKPILPCDKPLMHFVQITTDTDLTCDNIVWTALSLEGVGCNLQHYNFIPAFMQQVRDEWQLPATWELKSQMVFGQPSKPGFERDGPRPRTYLPVEERVLEFS